ncbi:hypothetical protein [Actinomycetospora chiangmaiensis]|uniref:hypothetical protein n=1 Tax=Actinomycetospora chiangmaiensis TaxID=402650 RepID=UPI00039BE190|nr:hypothetical protein [Actinomycetospora chiangmaiensis]
MITKTTSRGRALGLRVGATTLALAGATLLAACGSTGSSDTASSANSGAASSTANGAATANTAFDQCMSRNGVTRPSGGAGGGAPAGGTGGAPPSGAAQPSGQAPAGTAPSAGQAPPGVDTATWKKALAACQSEAGAPPTAGSTTTQGN